MNVLLFIGDHMNKVFIGDLEEEHQVELATREHDARRLIEQVARGERECNLIVMADERMSPFTMEQVRANHKVGLASEDYGDYRETGVRLCEYARELGLMDRGIPFICGSVLYEHDREESGIADRIECAGGEFVTMQGLKNAIQAHL